MNTIEQYNRLSRATTRSGELSPGERVRAAKALRFSAAALRREARSRKWAGETYAQYRRVLRMDADESERLAERLYPASA